MESTFFAPIPQIQRINFQRKDYGVIGYAVSVSALFAKECPKLLNETIHAAKQT